MYDVIVVGGGHAGIEASVAAARMGCVTLLLSQDLHSIGRLSCNPSIGGSAKGHLVKEIDALGGQMPYIADRSGLLFKMLNRSKGPAVWSPRSQNDKDLYPLYAQQQVLNTNNLSVLLDTATEIDIQNDTVKGLRTQSREYISCGAVILCSGTFLNGVLHTGKSQISGGRVGESSATSISDALQSYGIERGRLKTGTPPRVYTSSIDFKKTELNPGDEKPQPFSHLSSSVRNTLACYMTHTNNTTHSILQEGFNDSPMYSGRITGAGPRYCPSIEDKISRFVERDSHQIVLEPEGLQTDSVYVNGFSTSLPADIQERALHSIPGLEHCVIQRYGYAVEYDFFFPYQLRHSLESKAVSGLFFAGQINGTSGYEEAASQGLIAGINAALRKRGTDSFTLSRSEAYIGVMIDDLVNKNTEEPYRVFTSLAEYRLLLRQDNADTRLMSKGMALGLITMQAYEKFNLSTNIKNHLRDFCNSVRVLTPTSSSLHVSASGVSENPGFTSQEPHLSQSDATPSTNKSIEYRTITELAKRPEFSLNYLLEYTQHTELKSSIAEISSVNKQQENENLGLGIEPREQLSRLLRSGLNETLIEQVGFDIKYEGYIKRMNADIDTTRKSEMKKIPLDFNYDIVKSLSTEARVKLKKIRPETIGQATRISGISATDISILSLYLSKAN